MPELVRLLVRLLLLWMLTVILISMVVAHVTPPSWKKHLREISIEQLCDIHDRAYMRQAIIDNMLNSRTQELISAFYKAKTSYDAIQARELDKDRAYAELERKCNEALYDLDKNPLVFNMRAEIKALQGQVDGLHSEYSRLILEEKKWEIDSLKQDRSAVVSKVIPDAAMKLVHIDDLEVAAIEGPFVLEKMSGYRPSSKEEYDQVGDALANASYPFLA
ncbi:hypothetical protein Tco_1177296 [Tanacetum coccineum]